MLIHHGKIPGGKIFLFFFALLMVVIHELVILVFFFFFFVKKIAAIGMSSTYQILGFSSDW